MLMADNGSNLWSFDDFTAADDDMHLSMDVQSFLDILEESPNPSQNFPEDVTLKNVPQDDSTSFGGNNSLIRSGGPVLKVASSSGAELVVSATLSPSYNSEVSESRTGGSDGSFDSVGNSVLDIDVGKFEPSAHVGSPVHSQSGSLADWIPPTIGHDTTPAGRDGIASSCGRYRGEEIQLKMPSCSTPFSFSAADANYVSENRETLDFNHLDGETGPHFKCLEADSQYKYAFQDPSVDNRGVSYGKYCNSSKNSLKTSGIPDIMEPSIMYVDASLHNAYYSSSNVCEIPDVICGTGSQYPVLRYCMTTDNTSFASPSTQYLADNSFQLLSNDDEMMINMKDDVVELPTQNSFLSNTMIFGTHVGRAGGTVSQSPAIGNSNIRELSSECYGSNHISPSFLLSAPAGEETTNAKDERNDELIAPQVFQSSEFIDDDICQKFSGQLGCGILADKGSRHSFDGTLSPISIEKQHDIHASDEKEDASPASKRPCHSLDVIDEYACKNPTPVGDDRYLDAQTLKEPYVQPYALFGKQLGYTKDRNEITLSQPKIIGSCLLKGSCQTIQGSSLYHGSLVDEDDDSDICILEDISEPARSNKSLWSRNSLVTSQSSNFTDPFHHMGFGGVRSKTNDERLIFQVAMQDLSQTKSEASPPDGVLSVPLLRHQRIALSWMVQKETAGFHCSGGILADDQGLGKTVSTIALILKERSPSSILNYSDVSQNGIETLNLDEDDDNTVFEVDKQEANGSSVSSRNTSVQTKGRLAAGTLIVCPTSVLRQWAEELHNKVTSKANLSVLVYHGSNRTKDPLELAKYDVVLTTYSIVSMEVPKQPVVDKDDDETGKLETHSIPSMELLSNKKRKWLSSDKRSKKNKDSALLDSVARPLARVGWFRVVLDEAQSIKNYRTQVARACWGLRAKRRWCLSGTPIQNAVDDLYSYFRFLRYDPYAVYKSFCSTIKVPISKDPAKGYRKLQAVLKTIMLRRTKGTLLDGEPIITLPPKSIELKRVDFTDEERDFYCRLEADSRAQFAEYAAAGTVKENYVNILLMLLRLRQACDHPLLVKGYDSSCAWKSSVKMAKKLPQGKLIYLLNCLEASLAICGICNDPPEDAVVTRCGHVFCNQCICEHLTGDDSECPFTSCKAQISVSSVFSRATLRKSLSELPGMDHIPDCTGPELDETVEPCSKGSLLDSSKIKAALEVLQSLSKPQDCALRVSSLNFADESSSSPENLIGLPSEASLIGMPDQRSLLLDKDSKGSVKVMGDKAIVFSQWTGMLDLLEACLKNSSIQYRRLDGTMSVIARDKAVKDFNTLPEVSVMIMSLKAASLGLNMVAACHVLLLDLWWNPTTEDQAIDRAHRIGQTRPVTVLRLTVKDTVEDRILALQQKKREMVASAFGEDETGSRQSRLTTEDLKYLFMA